MHAAVSETGLHVGQDVELEHKVKKTCERISENLYIVANEPSLACYRLQEHIHKSLPQLVEKRLEVNQVHEDLQGKCYDLDYSLSAVKSMHGSLRHFQNIYDLLRNSVFMKQQLSYQESVRSEKKTLAKFHRFSGSFDHATSVVPNLPTGLSYSASATADLRSSTCNLSQKPVSTQHRSRASSMSLSSSQHAISHGSSVSQPSSPYSRPVVRQKSLSRDATPTKR
ncbi:BLOC-1-related complex subunit 8 homolog [Limulus polyphemus]|uniref:BLOC-1-related complex subunit 8 homolog n=1 Tax=Limulus polyphemus TaxID=6850 RepID=A0ABM1TPB0_LIMPO|nr:BLOC-1-related complex subunit 8 homolog [Limulus polyphemus]XP_022257716.1 BLOC-1-related complex subunit 8 homolog [Limulus polyphemus]XP_022257723.1 BLOC-1-related complex subunit 8 homolog [Limulus polyphemus]